MKISQQDNLYQTVQRAERERERTRANIRRLTRLFNTLAFIAYVGLLFYAYSLVSG